VEKIRTYLKRGEEHQIPAAQAMEGLLRLLRFDPALYAVFEIWDRETRGLIRGCEASGIQGTRLCVKVPSAAHRQEILYIKDRLLSRVNQALGRRMITDIQFELAGDATRVNVDKGGTIRVQEQARTTFDRYGKR
jgi:hypothetical protein